MVLKQLNTSRSPAKDVNSSKINPVSCSLDSSALQSIEVGLHSSEHYQQILPPWRFRLRQNILPLIRWETPYLAWIQNKIRMPVLDSYFAITANLGTHTFFMVILPILFWCGYTSLGRGMVHVLANGVFLTGILKDLLSLPRPLTPPLHRISMSKSASMEYGFPSTHSANATSVAVYVLITLYSLDYKMAESSKTLIEGMAYLYVFTITFGRLYCGMHGFIDIIVGGTIGIIISVFECTFATAINKFLLQSSWVAPTSVAIVMLLLILAHPKPADECPCFDDTVAFAGVLIGIEAGGWHYANSSWAWDSPIPATVPFNLKEMGWTVAILRIIVGVIVIFVWRKTIKLALLRSLPRLFCKIDTYGLIIYQKYFEILETSRSSNHQRVESLKSTTFNLVSLLNSTLNLIKGYSIYVTAKPSIQTHESLNVTDNRRRGCVKCNDRCKSLTIQRSSHQMTNNHVSMDIIMDRDPSLIQVPENTENPELYPKQEKPTLMFRSLSSGTSHEQAANPDYGKTQVENKEISDTYFQGVCCRYNVEVITKLIVYIGIGWLSVEINPIIFEIIGLGLGRENSRSFYI